MTVSEQTPAADNSSLYTVRWESTTGYPYLGSRERDDVLLTCIRQADQEAMVQLCNIPTVGQWFYHRAYPFTIHDFEKTFALRNPSQLRAIAALKEGTSPTAFPFTVIRDPKTDRYIGELDIFPSKEHPSSDEIWEVSYVLHPDFQGKGIAQALVRMALEWAGTAMGVRKVEAYAQCRNVPSTKVLDKLGFTCLDVKTYPWPEDKGGGEVIVGRYQKEL